jgi:hypothetical protein
MEGAVRAKYAGKLRGRRLVRRSVSTARSK